MSIQKKPPVVVVMGHVDHGKTSLLDYIRKTKLASKEYGEITQSIGAYQIQYKGEKITFIDTPGHEAFNKMRVRGASIADLVILVVAANDGVMQQTKESLRIIKESNVPFIVALNKIDLPDASPDKVKGQLAENEVFVEGYGGNTVVVPVSAKTGEGIDRLLEMVILMTDMSELKADPEADLEAVVIESRMDKNCGPIANLIIKNGTLRRGDEIETEGIVAKIKMLKNELGEGIEEAFPSDPVQIMGFSSTLKAGSLIGKLGKSINEEDKKTVSLAPQAASEAKLKIILKGDVAGSLEAVLGCLSSDVQVILSGVGEVSDSDVLLAKNVGADIYGFNIGFSSGVKKLAETEKVKIKTYRIIYELFADIEKRILKILEPTINRKVLGKAEILAIFEMKGEKIAGCRVLEGKINRGWLISVQRNGQIVADTRISSMKNQKQDINEASINEEFGTTFKDKVDFQKGDMVLSYSLEED